MRAMDERQRARIREVVRQAVDPAPIAAGWVVTDPDGNVVQSSDGGNAPLPAQVETTVERRGDGRNR
jgi:hypothetical protein